MCVCVCAARASAQSSPTNNDVLFCNDVVTLASWCNRIPATTRCTLARSHSRVLIRGSHRTARRSRCSKRCTLCDHNGVAKQAVHRVSLTIVDVRALRGRVLFLRMQRPTLRTRGRPSRCCLRKWKANRARIVKSLTSAGKSMAT